MATEEFVVSTLYMRLEQCDVLLDWLMTRHPDQTALDRAMECIRTAQIIVKNTAVGSH